MPNPPHSLSTPPTKEGGKQPKGIDYSRAYHSLIKGFVQVYTVQKLEDNECKKDEQGEQQ